MMSPGRPASATPCRIVCSPNSCMAPTDALASRPKLTTWLKGRIPSCRYGRIWEYLRREFDVETRFETIEDKVCLHLRACLNSCSHCHMIHPSPHETPFATSAAMQCNVACLLQLELVQSSLKYFLELRQHSKSDTLEWVSALPSEIGVVLAVRARFATECYATPTDFIGSYGMLSLQTIIILIGAEIAISLWEMYRHVGM